MIPVNTAEQLILEAIQPLGNEWVDLSHACTRVIAASITSSADVPAYDTSSMDGYAVRYADVTSLPCSLSVIETVPAGHYPQRSVQPSQATRVFTGSILPSGADTVVIQEQTERLDPETVTIGQSGSNPLAQGQFVRKQGHFCRAGAVVIPVGCRVGGPELAVMAAVGRSTVQVYRRPQVGILSTGNELVRIDQVPQPGQIVDSNQYGLAALVEAAGGIPHRLGIVPDDPERLKGAIQQALQTTDLVISSGGVSVGDYDYVESILESLGGEIRIRKVAIKPGKPLTWAVFAQEDRGPKLYFGLPGNPVSAMVTFWRFVRPALAKLQGQDPLRDPQWTTAITDEDLRSDGQRETYTWGRLSWHDGSLRFRPLGSQQSADLINLAGCHGLAVLPVGSTQIKAGEIVQIMLIPS